MTKNYFILILAMVFGTFSFAQDRDLQITWVNEADYIPAGGTSPTLEAGDTFPVTLNYSTAISGPDEQDLHYVAMMLRQIDAAFGNIKTSTFTVVIDGDAANADEVTFDYTLPTTFDDGTPIPNTADLTNGDQLILLIFMSANADSAFADDNTVVNVVESLSVEDETINRLTVGPNPFDSTLNISGLDFSSDSYNAIVYNSLGQIVYTNKSVVKNELNLESLDSGIYYLKISSDATNESKTMRIIRK